MTNGEKFTALTEHNTTWTSRDAVLLCIYIYTVDPHGALAARMRSGQSEPSPNGRVASDGTQRAA